MEWFRKAKQIMHRIAVSAGVSPQIVVYPDRADWAVRFDIADALRRFTTRAAAIQYAREWAGNHAPCVIRELNETQAAPGKGLAEHRAALLDAI